jgi:anti-sigma regulatory factor (Ser/Thr protein kinase)/GAF domain-containing protein
MRLLQLAALLIYSFGIFAYGSMLALWFRELSRATTSLPDQTTPAGVRTFFVAGALWTVSLLWFVTNVVEVVIALDPAQPRGWPWTTARWAFFWLAMAFPPLIVHIVWAEVAEYRGTGLPRVWGAIVALMYVLAGTLAIVCTLGFVGALNIPDRIVGQLAGSGNVALFVGAAVYSAALLARHSAVARTPREAQSTRWHIVLFGAMGLIFVLLLALDRQGRAALIGRTFEMAARSLPLMFMFVGTYFGNRFEFFDIFVKRGLSLLITLGLLALSFAATFPILHRFDASWAAPWVYGIVLLPFAMALPALHSWIGRTLDRRWLGRRFSTVAAVKHFLSELRSATTEAQLVQQAETGLASIFDAPVAVRLAGHSSSESPAFEPVHEVEVVSAEGVAGRFLLGGRRNEAPYFSEDVALLGSLSDVFGSVLDNLRLQLREQEQDRRARDLSLHASRSELKALRAQINPHFLFNALNSIAGLIHRDPEVADRTIEKLADVFRYALRGSEAEWTLLDDELEFVQAYLDVEHARFGARLSADVQLADDARGARVPTMVIQTLVENALKHGAATVRGQAIVNIAARRNGDRLLITVEDNGAGLAGPVDEPRGDMTRPGGYGLANIRRRLDGYFGSAATLRIERDEARGRTTASIEMPFVTHGFRADRPLAGSEVPR